MKQTVSKSIRIPFLPDELNAMGKRLAEIGARKSSLQEEKKAEQKHYDGLIAELEEEELLLRRYRLDEYRTEVRDCFLEYDLATNTKRYFLPDTMELVAEDPIGPNEQIPLAAAKDGAENVIDLATRGLTPEQIGALRSIAEKHARSLMRTALHEKREPTMRERAKLTSDAMKEAEIPEDRLPIAARFYTAEVNRAIEQKFSEFEALKGESKTESAETDSSREETRR